MAKGILILIAALIVLIQAACSPGISDNPATAVISATNAESSNQDVPRPPTPTRLPEVAVPDVRGAADAVQIPGYFSAIPFDGIRPIYDPIFVNGVDAPLHAEELVLGVAWDGQAKAYPITVLRFREMVNDELSGLPILVSW